MSAAPEIQAFDVCGPLPQGVTVLEASAGTGKTFTIAALAARYVAEGIALDRLLVVTFTRMATAELRDRVRDRIVQTEQELERFLLSGEEPADEVSALLCRGARDEVELRRERLARALGDFDAATIVTTHGFCQEVLGGLGILGDLEPGATLIEETRDLVEEVVDDLYVRKFHAAEKADFDRTQALEIALAAAAHPDTGIEPAPGSDDLPAVRASLAHAVRRELRARMRRNGVLSYDDLLLELDHALERDARGVIAARLRSRYSVVLVDEFQDTDPVQWRIMDRAFGTGIDALVLIGDPKQAIYAFRGADVYAYLKARGTATFEATLDVNWRSDQGLIDAYDRVFGRAQLGHPGIVYRQVRACEPHHAARLSGAHDDAPLRVRVVERGTPSVGVTNGGFAPADDAREHIAQDLAADVVQLLRSDAQIDVGGESETVRPGHLAVLVRRNADAELVRRTLEEHGVPAVLNGAGSVFATTAANDWLRLLEALERPASPSRAHAAALTAFLGRTTEWVATADDDEWEQIHHRLHTWAGVLRVKGVAALMESITLVERLAERLLRCTDGERRLTDLRHVAQLLHATAMDEQLGVAALTVWLRRRIAAAAEEGDEERSRRLESDAAAVQVLTIHRSKGLEFPIVYLPYLWHPTWIKEKPPVPVTFHDGTERKVDVGLGGPLWDQHKAQYVAEQRGEDLRLAYVALTRARHQAVVWWAGTRDSRHSPLGRLVFARGEDGSVPEFGTDTPSDSGAFERFEELADGVPGCISVAWARPGSRAERWSGIPTEHRPLTTSRFDRDLDWRWRRTSYSDITAGAHDARVASEPEEDIVDDEAPATLGLVRAPAVVEPSPLLEVRSLLADMPAGVHIGTFIHGVFEAADFAAPELDAELGAWITRVQARRPVELGDREDVLAGLRAAIETPLGAVLGNSALRAVARADRLDELDFELPLVGGDEPTGRLTLAAIAAVLRRHVPADDPLAGYADRLEDPGLRPDVRGFLTGSIDLVARTHAADGTPRFAIVDYKTNWLGTPGEELTAWHYRPEALATEMQRSHYVLQALLYTVALHRYLRWRLPDYAPGRHLAGTAYLFLRGMLGPDGPPTGVFTWQPSAALVEELSDVLDRGEPAPAAPPASTEAAPPASTEAAPPAPTEDAPPPDDDGQTTLDLFGGA